MMLRRGAASTVSLMPGLKFLNISKLKVIVLFAILLELSTAYSPSAHPPPPPTRALVDLADGRLWCRFALGAAFGWAWCGTGAGTTSVK